MANGRVPDDSRIDSDRLSVASTHSETHDDNPSVTRLRRDYLSLSDEEIVSAQCHAERVGYKVSTV